MSKDKDRIQKLNDLIIVGGQQKMQKILNSATKKDLQDKIVKYDNVISDLKVSFSKGNKSDLFNSEIEFVNNIAFAKKYKIPSQYFDLSTLLINLRNTLNNRLINKTSVKKHNKDLQEKLDNIDPKNIPNMKKDERDEQLMYASEAMRILKDIEKKSK